MSEVYSESKLMIPQVLLQLRVARDKLAQLLQDAVNDASSDILQDAHARLTEACGVLKDDYFAAPSSCISEPPIDYSSDSSEY